MLTSRFCLVVVMRSGAERSGAERSGGEVHAAIARIDALERSVAEARSGQAAALRHYRIQLARFEAGAALGVEVIGAQNALARIRLELVDTVLRFNAEQIDLLAVLGQLDPEALDIRDRRGSESSQRALEPG